MLDNVTASPDIVGYKIMNVRGRRGIRDGLDYSVASFK